MIIYTLPVADSVPIKTLVAGRLQTNVTCIFLVICVGGGVSATSDVDILVLDSPSNLHQT